MMPGTYSYRVKEGDTLSKIAKQFSTTVEKLAKDNNITNPNIIHIGQLITIKVENKTTTVEKDNDQVKKALKNCLSAIESLPEYKELTKLL